MTDPLSPVHGERDLGRARPLLTVLPAQHDGVTGELFVGDVRARVLRDGSVDGALAVMTTTFVARASTAWHAHDGDQVLVVAEGRGALEDDEHGRQELAAGDVVVVPAGRVHRHLAGETDSMTHLSITTPGLHHLRPRPRSS